jgi:hypothetical protein
MHQNHSYDHVHGDPERCDSRQAPEKQADATEKLSRDRQDGEECRNIQALREHAEGLIESGAAKPAEYLLGAVREKDYAENDA